jgi:hypothetical protein
MKPAKTKNISFTQNFGYGITAKDQHIMAVIRTTNDVDTTNNIIVYRPIE